MNETILITGASGFLGTWLAETVHKLGYDLIGVDLRVPYRPHLWTSFSTSSCEAADFEALLGGRKLRAVFHLAGGAAVGASVSDPYGDFSSLLPGTARLAIYIARKHQSARFFLFSSAAVYGNPCRLPIEEIDPLSPISPYGVHKATAEFLLMHYVRILGLNVSIMRIFSVYGPGLRKQLIWDVCQKIIRAQTKNENSITLWGTGNESRDFISVHDVCGAAMALMQQEETKSNGIYNIASGVETTVSSVATIIVKAMDATCDVVFSGEASKGDPVNWRACVRKLDAIGFTPSTSMDTGLNEVARWVRSLG